VVLRAAMNPTGIASTAASVVPRIAMHTVIRARLTVCATLGNWGGTVWPTNRKMFPTPENSGSTPMPMSCQPATTPATPAITSTTMPPRWRVHGGRVRTTGGLLTVMRATGAHILTAGTSAVAAAGAPR